MICYKRKFFTSLPQLRKNIFFPNATILTERLLYPIVIGTSKFPNYLGMMVSRLYCSSPSILCGVPEDSAIPCVKHLTKDWFICMRPLILCRIPHVSAIVSSNHLTMTIHMQLLYMSYLIILLISLPTKIVSPNFDYCYHHKSMNPLF